MLLFLDRGRLVLVITWLIRVCLLLGIMRDADVVRLVSSINQICIFRFLLH
jgi:hypothetical protein